MELTQVTDALQCSGCLEMFPPSELKSLGNLKICVHCYPQAQLLIQSSEPYRPYE